MNLSLFRYALVLMLLALAGGIFVPAMAVPRLGLSAHTIGMLSGVLLIAIGAIWSHFILSARLCCLLKWSWLYASYANWFGCMLGAVLGAGSMTPVAAPGVRGSALAELTVMLLLLSVALASFLAVGLSLWGLRRRG